jgi:purine-binding chemotaxis protein CheW
MTAAVTRSAALWVTAGSRTCCIPLVHVVETMRPMPVVALTDAPSFVAGLSVIRGAPVPVVDLAAAMGAGDAGPASRCVVLRVGLRRVALHVTSVIGVRDVTASDLEDLPPLLKGANADVIASVRALDAELFLVLQASRLLTEEAWSKLDLAASTA